MTGWRIRFCTAGLCLGLAMPASGRQIADSEDGRTVLSFAQAQGGEVAASPTPRLSGFSVSLVEGDLEGTGATDALTAAAAKALADLRDFLPYRSYRLLDTQWTLGSGKLSSRLRGPGGREYELQLQTSYPHYAFGFEAGEARRAVGSARASRMSPSAQVSISRFVLREAGAGAGTGGLEPIARMGDVASVGGAPLIDTSFRMDVGETVVVGTSRLQGSTALIVLLTAVGRQQ
jgi:hypothetical protein